MLRMVRTVPTAYPGIQLSVRSVLVQTSARKSIRPNKAGAFEFDSSIMLAGASDFLLDLHSPASNGANENL